MATTQMDIRNRPFSVEFFTKIMLPDGIFDTALTRQWITCYYTNTSAVTLKDVIIYLEGVGDPGITTAAQDYVFTEIKAGASVRVAWLGNFEHGSPGKKLVSFIAQAKGKDPVRTLKNIFVSKTVKDPVTGVYTCSVEEGELKVTGLQMIGPKDRWQSCDDKNKECRPTKGPWVPKKMSMVFYPNPSYSGIHGDLPFSDPWWKILAWIVAAIAALVAIIAAAYGEGTAGVGVSGTFEGPPDPSVDCCTPDPGAIPGDDGLTVAGVASGIALVAVAVGLSDAEDPWWRGQKATSPAKTEKTIAEKVEVVFDYPGGAPNAGEAFPVDVSWKYQRVTTGRTYTHSVTEQQKNIHVSGGVEVETPQIHHAFSGPLVVKAKFKKQNAQLFAGEELYAFALLRSPDNMYFFLDLRDDGIAQDDKPNDGVYTGSIHFEKLYKSLLKKQLKLEGLWRVYVFAQDINNATPDMLPQIAAQRIGGFMIASAVELHFDSTLPCPLKAQTSFTVVI